MLDVMYRCGQIAGRRDAAEDVAPADTPDVEDVRSMDTPEGVGDVNTPGDDLLAVADAAGVVPPAKDANLHVKGSETVSGDTVAAEVEAWLRGVS